MNTVSDPLAMHSTSGEAPGVASVRREPLASLERRDAFVARHIGTSHEDQMAMLDSLGYATRRALIDAIVPAAIRRPASGPEAMALPDALPEAEALE